MKLKNVLIVVNDIKKSKKFYHDLFGLDMILDNDGNMIKPAHPIIDKIKGGEETIDILLPMNVNDEGVNFWLPKDLWSL